MHTDNGMCTVLHYSAQNKTLKFHVIQFRNTSRLEVRREEIEMRRLGLVTVSFYAQCYKARMRRLTGRDGEEF
jgi:hypothetical protein